MVVCTAPSPVWSKLLILMPKPPPFARRVPGGAARDDARVVVEEDRVLHPERLEDSLLREDRERLAGDALHDDREEEVAGVRVAPLSAGGEVQRLLVGDRVETAWSSVTSAWSKPESTISAA